MSVELHIENLSKKFGSQPILKSINLKIYSNEKIAILGANGSGKSTLLKIMAGFLYFDKGKVTWEIDGKIIENPDFSFSSPYLDLFEHLSLGEHIAFHFDQKNTYTHLSLDEIIGLGNLENYKKKQIRQLSSGVKQRFKNVLAIFTDADVLFLDEPCSNLDEENIKLYQNLVKDYTKDRMVIIASNNPLEYDLLCSKEFKIENGELHLLRNKQLWA
ncbi:MAG: ATP-binding cassette domain-containing protein [Bacteroidia bacterium]